MKGMIVKRCDYCEKESDELYVCGQCDDEICPDCTATYNQFTLIDYTLCLGCETKREVERTAYAERRDFQAAKEEGRLYIVIHLYLIKPATAAYQIRNRSR